MSMEKSIYQRLSDWAAYAWSELKGLGARSKLPFLISLLVGLLVHFPIYSYGLLNPDAMWMSEEYIGGWEVTLGRWALWIFDYLHGGVNSPILMAFLTLCFFSLGGVLLNELFGVTHPAARILIPICITASPLVSITMTYYYCSDAYAFSFLLSVIAILLVVRKRSVATCITGSLCIALALGIYQSNLGVAAVLAALTLLFAVMEAPQAHKVHRKLLLQLLITGILGVGLYYFILRVSLSIQGLSMMSYKGADTISIASILWNLPSGAAYAYQDFFDFFARDTIMINSYLVRVCYSVIFAAFLCVFLWKLAKIRADKLSVLSAIALLCLLPLCCNLIDVAAPHTRIILLTSGGLHCLCPAAIAFCSKQLPAVLSSTSKKAWVPPGRLITLCAGALLIWNFAIIINADAMVMKNVTEQQVALANRICARMEENEDYLHGAQVMVVGTPKNGNYPVVSRLAAKVNQYAYWGLVWGTPDGLLNGWYEIFRQKLGVLYNRCYEAQYQDIVASADFKSMPIFPAQDAIRTIDGIVVIKVSEVTP